MSEKNILCSIYVLLVLFQNVIQFYCFKLPAQDINCIKTILHQLCTQECAINITCLRII